MRKLGPPLLAGEATFCGENFPSVVLPFTHDTFPDIHLKKQNNQTTPVLMFVMSYERILHTYLSSRTGHSLRFSSPLHCCHRPPRAGVYRWQWDESRSWTLCRQQYFTGTIQTNCYKLGFAFKRSVKAKSNGARNMSSEKVSLIIPGNHVPGVPGFTRSSRKNRLLSDQLLTQSIYGLNSVLVTWKPEELMAE